MKTRYTLPALFLVSALLLTGCIAAAPAAPQAAPIENYANTTVLVDTKWVQDHLSDPTVRILEISGKREDYDAGHLPGAQYIHLSDDLTNPDDPVKGQILTGEQLAPVMSRVGVTNDSAVLLYDNNSNLLAARAYWVLKYYQHKGEIYIYNGGTKKWQADGQALVTEVGEVTPSEYVVGEADPNIRTTGEYVLEHLDDPSTAMCDTRGAEEFAGTDVRSARGGHIPGAINLEWRMAVNEDGTFKDAPVLADLYQKAGFTPDKEIITYCQTGVRGAHTWFVLKELLGYPKVRNYDGSWEEWGNNPESPIES